MLDLIIAIRFEFLLLPVYLYALGCIIVIINNGYDMPRHRELSLPTLTRVDSYKTFPIQVRLIVHQHSAAVKYCRPTLYS